MVQKYAKYLFPVCVVLILFQIKIIFQIYMQDEEEVYPLPNCKPMLENQTQFYAEIDGELYPKIVPSFFNRSINFDCLNSKTKVKKILLWNDFGPWIDFKYGLGVRKPFVNRKCPVTNCEMTTDRKELHNSDLVIIHMRGKFSDLPERATNKRSDSRWVFFMMESPIYSKNFSHLDQSFDLTATYKFDSYFTPYYYANIGFDWGVNESFNESRNYLAEKTNFSAILVSHCPTHSERLRYVKEMQKYVSVDVYGQCGRSCQIKNENRYLSKKCREMISNKYMFFLAFENSFCDDYVTEKLFDSILFDSVPVVYGLGNYEKWLPKSAYINALDFASPRLLAEYLLYLSKNPDAYNAYFKWKKFIIRTNNEFKSFCDMCIKLHLEDFYGRVDLQVPTLNWGYQDNCKKPVFGNDSFSLEPITEPHVCDICI